MSDSPLVTVIVPVFNGARYLAAALSSALAQTYRPLELVVVDDGSTDATREIALAYPDVHYLYQPHAGLATALNTGLAAASGELLAFLDSDDLWPPDRLALQVSALLAEPALDILFGHLVPFSDVPAAPAGPPVPGLLKGTLVARRPAFARVGPFDPQWRLGDFVEWFLRARDLGLTSRMLPAVVLYRRRHGDNMTLRDREHRLDYVHILKRALDRRRVGPSAH